MRAMKPLDLANLAVGLSFLVSMVVPFGSILVDQVLSGPVLWEMRGIARDLPGVLGNYWIPAIAIYLILKYSRFSTSYDISSRAHAFIGAGNAMLVFYLLLRLYASTIPGGGAGFVVAGVGSLILALPGYACLAVGAVLVIATKKANPLPIAASEARSAASIGVAEGICIVAASAVPLASALWLYGGSASPFRLAREAEQLFNARCLRAGETISRRVTSKGLYIEKDEIFRLDNLRDGVYAGIGFGSLGKSLQEQGVVEFYEIRRHASALQGVTEYLRFLPSRKDPLVVSERLSEHALLWRQIASPSELALRISGNEYSILDLRSGIRVATAVLFVSSMHRKICGHPGGSSYGVVDFVRRVIEKARPAPSR